MDKTKKMTGMLLLMIGMAFSISASLCAQNVEKIKFCDRKYEYEIGKDTITLYFNLFDKDSTRLNKLTEEELKNNLTIKEDGDTIPGLSSTISAIQSGVRIPSGYTFSVLVDLTIPEGGKEQIYAAIKQLVDNAPDSCVYLSFFGDTVTSSKVVTKAAFGDMASQFHARGQNKCFYSGVYSKLREFATDTTDEDALAKVEEGYRRNTEINSRAKENDGKNLLFIFTGGSRPQGDMMDYKHVTDYIKQTNNITPKVFALYYTEEHGQNPAIESTLKGICDRQDIGMERRGKYCPSNDMDNVLQNFQEAVEDAMYDYAFSYKVGEEKTYSRNVKYSAQWGRKSIGEKEFGIGTAERSWPIRVEKNTDVALKYLYAVLVVLLTIAFFVFIIKIIIPFCRSKSFEVKYYKKYVPEANVSKRICHYCKQEIQPGQVVVTKCKHIMHVFCWQQNGYKCAEYGQNCKTGIQSHVEWRELFTMTSLKDCYQTISGILAGFISWVLYEISGGTFFDGMSSTMVEWLYSSSSENQMLFHDCVTKTSAFLTIGLFLGFFLSLIFRYNDEFKKKDWKVWLKILGLSVLTGAIGMIAFAIGANILCMLLSVMDNPTYIPWYCSLPAYLLFSISVSLALTIKSTIPVKSAMIGGLCSALIGFIVLYCSSHASDNSSWMNMLLDFIIYGGGLGASLVTVRMLAEKYYLVIQNGVRAGQRIPIHKWMNATGGGNKVSIGMTGECEIQMNWEKSNKVAKEHVQLFIDYDKQLPMIKPLATGVIYNTRAELPVGRPSVLSNGDTFKIGDTIFLYQETD